MTERTMRTAFVALDGVCLFRAAGSASRTRTYDRAINSRLLYQLSYRGSAESGSIADHRAGSSPNLLLLSKNFGVRQKKAGDKSSRRGVG